MKVGELKQALSLYPDDMEVITPWTNGLVDYFIQTSNAEEVKVCKITKHPDPGLLGAFVDARMAEAAASRMPENGCEVSEAMEALVV